MSHPDQRQRLEFHQRADPCRFSLYFNSAGQFKMTLIGSDSSVIGTAKRKRLPSFATAYVDDPAENSFCGGNDANPLLVSTLADMRMKSDVRKNSSFPSPRHFGKVPPSRET